MNIGVVIPAKNAEHTIERAIQSVLTQSVSPKEIVVVVDASTDGTANVANRFAEVKIIYTDYSNRAMARNAGVNALTTDWVAFLDSDDEWMPDKLKHQLHFTNSHTADLFFHDLEIRTEDRVITSWSRHCRGEHWHRQLECRNFVCLLDDLL